MATCPTCKTRYANDVKTCEVDGDGLLPDEAFSGLEPDLPAGQKVGEYEIEAKIGEGGFGSVYRAVHPLIGKAAAIKVLNRQYSSNPQMVSRFIAEARAVNQIRNRNIIDIFSFGNLEDGRAYYVMELLDGVTFDKYLRERGPIPPEEAIPILRGIARALDAAHAAGIAHRDLKPENVFLVIEDDGAVFPKLLDFGIAKLLGDSAQAGHKTRTGTPLGTPHYMSPEQCRGKNVDHRTDIYSFGILAHETLTGQLPFNGEDVMEILVKQTTATPPAMSSVLPSLPAALDAPLLHMLEKDPAKRPTSMIDAVEDLATAAQAAGLAVPHVARGSARKTPGEGGVGRAKGLTPAEMGALAEARTMMQEEPKQTLMASANSVKPAQGKRTVLYAIAAIALLGGVGGGIALSRSGAGPEKSTPTAVAAQSPAPEPSSKPTAVATDAPNVTPAASATADAQATDVELTFESTPKAVDVYLGSTKLGAAPGPIKVKRADGTVKLTFKASGYKSLEKDVSAAKSDTVSVELAKAAAVVAPGPGKKRRDLEF